MIAEYVMAGQVNSYTFLDEDDEDGDDSLSSSDEDII